MKSTCTIRRGQAAYTMVELMVAVLISVILMVAMYQIFARVQKIFTEGNHRGKMYEEGRVVMDLIVRDLKQIAPSGEKSERFQMPSMSPTFLPFPLDVDTPAKRMEYLRGFGEEWGFNLPIVYDSDPILRAEPDDNGYHPFYVYNFMAWPYSSTELKVVVDDPPGYSESPRLTHPGWKAAISETLVSSRVEFFAQDVEWRVMGYRLYSQNNPVERNRKIIGALWRFESPSGTAGSLRRKVRGLRNNGGSLYRKLSDNVIHFRMRAVSRDDPAHLLWDKPCFDDEDVPLYVEVELGIIEERLKKEILNDAEVERYDVLIEDDPTDTNLQIGRNVRVRKMLAANTDRILMLRQIVPITSAMGN